MGPIGEQVRVPISGEHANACSYPWGDQYPEWLIRVALVTEDWDPFKRVRMRRLLLQLRFVPHWRGLNPWSLEDRAIAQHKAPARRLGPGKPERSSTPPVTAFSASDPPEFLNAHCWSHLLEASEFRVLAFLGGDRSRYHKFLFDIVLSSLPGVFAVMDDHVFSASVLERLPLADGGVASAALHDGRFLAGPSLVRTTRTLLRAGSEVQHLGPCDRRPRCWSTGQR